MASRIEVNVAYNLKQPVNELKVLEDASKKAETEIKKIEKAIKATSDISEKSKLRESLTAAKEAANSAKKEMEDLAKKTDINKMTFSQLGNFVNRLEKELKGVVKGTEDYARISKQLEPAAKLYNQQRTEINALKNATTENTTVMGTFKEVLFGTFGGNLLFAGISKLKDMLVGLFSTSISEFTAFEVAAQDLKGEVDLTEKQFASLKKEAREVGPAFGKTAKEMLDAYNVVGSGKSELTQTERGLQDVTEAALQLSIAGGVELKNAAGTVTDSLNQYGKSADQAAKFVDIMATGSKVGAAKIEELSASLRYAGPVASSLNISFAATNGLLQVMSTNGIKGQQAGTALRGTLLRLASQNDDTVNPSIVGTTLAFENLAKKNLTAAEMTKLVGTENVSAALGLVANVPKIKAYTAEIEKGGGANEMFAEKTKTLSFEINKAKAFLLNKAVAFGEILAPAIRTALTAGIAFINMLVALPRFLNENKVVIFGVIAALVAFDLSLAQSNLRLLASTAATKAKIIWDKAVAVTTGLMTAAQNGLNMAMRANPIGLIITLLIALGTAVYAAYQNSQTFRAALNGVFNLMKTGLRIIFDMHNALLRLDFKALANSFTTATTKMKDAYTKGYSDVIIAESKKAKENVVKDHSAKAAASKKFTGDQINDVKDLTETTKKSHKAIEESKKKTLKEIEKAYDAADKDIRKRLTDHVKNIKTTNAEELKEHEKLQEELRKNALQMATFRDSTIKLERIKKATSLKEIEDIEKEYSDRAMERELEDSKERLRIKETELTLLKAMGVLNVAEEDKRKAEILKLKSELSKKEIAIVKKSVKEKTDALKEEAELHDNLQKEQTRVFEIEKEKQQKIAERHQQNLSLALSSGHELAMQFFDKQDKALQDKLSKATTSVEKFRAQNDAEFNQIGRNLTTLAANLAAGNFPAAVGNALQYISQFVKLFSADTEYAKAQLEDLYVEVKKQTDAYAALLNTIQNVYGKLTEPTIPDWVKEMSDSLSDSLLNMGVNSIEIELKKGESIQKTFDLQVKKENEYTDLVKKNIQEAFNKEIEAINAKYDLIAVKNSQRFSEESIGIQQAVNRDLLKFIENQDLKISLTKEYEKRKADIATTFAIAYKPITEGMSQTEIDGINAAIKARDAAFAQLENWQTQQINFTIENGKLQIDTFTAVEKIIQKGKDDTYKLELSYQALEIQNNIQKNAEIEKAQKQLNQALETEAKRYNQAILDLGIAKDKALMESFTRLRDLVNEGYQSMIDNAIKLYNQGIITTQQFEELVNTANRLRDLVNPANFPTTAPTPTPTNPFVPFIPPIDIPLLPRFDLGTRQVVAGMGGIPSGPRHGASYGKGGIALVHRFTGAELGEMEGEEAIIPREQTKANMPLIDLMLAKARRGDNTPLGMYKFGGFLLPEIQKNMYLFGSKTRKAQVAAAESAAAAALASQFSGGSLAADPEASATVQGNLQITLLEGIQDAIVDASNRMLSSLQKIESATAATSDFTKATSSAIREKDAKASLNSMLEKLRSFR